jgi:two-component system, LuxR family, response regulator FixJ
MVQSMGLPTHSFSNAEQFLSSMIDEPHGCLITDIRLRGMSGLQLLKEISAHQWELPLIIVTSHGDIRLAVESLKAGAFTFLEKPYRDQELWEAIVQAIEESKTRLDDRKSKQHVNACLRKLTAEETKILRELLRSTPLKTIAAKLNLSLRTIDLRRRSILDKLQVESKIDLAKVIMKAGISIDET